MIRRFSSRHGRLDHLFLREKLRGAKRYFRIAGYFRSSLLELIHEELKSIDEVRVVCNSDLDPRDISAARTAEQQAMALKEKWSERPPEADSLLGRDRYKKLHELLVRGNLQVRVVGKAATPFVHGKAGVIDGRDGSSTAFMGSNNETREGWREHYELLWEDDSPEAIAWVREEFEYLWSQGVPLPRAIIEEVDRCARRVEYRSVEECPPESIAAATMAEAPIYSRGEALMPWQRAFTGMFLEHRDYFGATRMLLADEVGLGKTLSLATSTVLACLLGDGPALILCPATLTQQWQVELWDKLGVPSAVWTSKKTWLDHTGHHIRTRGPEDVARCPYQIGIVSTGLIFHRTDERHHLLRKRFGTLVLDEAHRARRAGGTGRTAGQPNNLLDFVRESAKNARHVLLGTATPIQTEVGELWGLLDVLGQGAEYVLGRAGSLWHTPSRVLGFITGAKAVEDEGECWDLIRNPLPPRDEDALFDHIRTDLGLNDEDHFTSRPRYELAEFTREELLERTTQHRDGLAFFQQHNPMVRHTVLRKRKVLEAKGLLPRIAVDIHPIPEHPKPFFVGLGLLTSPPIDAAYNAAKKFTDLLKHRTRSAGFIEGLLLLRICSSLAAGLATARKLLGGKNPNEEDEDEDANHEELSSLTDAEREALEEVVEHLRVHPVDPKFEAVLHYLIDEHWLDHGCIIFSHYYDTARWVAERLAEKLPSEPIALYAGADRSRMLRGDQHVHVERESIKSAVKEREVRLVVATDAACEGLNLQTLGTLINVDLPWNPSRLEQRIGRIKRFGQARDSVDMLNLVYQGTRDEEVYDRLSSRMRDRYDVFGALPDVIEDDWIDHIETLDDKLTEFIEKKRRANAFDIRYADTVEPKGEPWEKCAQVLSRRDVIERLSRGW
ncbi:phospholipase D-like domain-containing protein [Pendulispora brunnea]|uniref:Phospholipase D-like domain-containing protein n=1 Tax=Pendulispora brunnea TaxID=2905690 RepID=A0ABZ2JZJ7_9BACT